MLEVGKEEDEVTIEADFLYQGDESLLYGETSIGYRDDRTIKWGGEEIVLFTIRKTESGWSF